MIIIIIIIIKFLFKQNNPVSIKKYAGTNRGRAFLDQLKYKYTQNFIESYIESYI